MSWNHKLAFVWGKAPIAAAAVLVAVGAAGGAAAVSMTRPPIVMAPSVPTAIAKLSAATGMVAVKGRVSEIFGDRFVLQDGSGRTMIDAGRGDELTLTPGDTVTAQGTYDNGELHAAFLIDRSGQIHAVGPRGPRLPDEGPGRDHHGKQRDDGPIGVNDKGSVPVCAPADDGAQVPPTSANAVSLK